MPNTHWRREETLLQNAERKPTPALSVQFLKSVDALTTVPGEVQTARLQLVRGLDGCLEAHTPSGASVELSWRFAQAHV